MQMETLRQNAVYKGIVKKGLGLVQSGYLLLIIALQNGKASYAFAINQNNSNPIPRPNERRLNQNDAFVATHGGLYLVREDSAKPGSGVLQSYPNATVFADEATYLAGADLEAVFNSALYIKVDDTVYGEAIDMRPTRVVRTTQQSSGTTKSENHSFDGLIPFEPIITFDGSKKNDIVLNIPTWAGQLIQNSTANAGQTVYAALKFYGFLVTGGSGLGRMTS